jgi:hypothetical protein
MNGGNSFAAVEVSGPTGTGLGSGGGGGVAGDGAGSGGSEVSAAGAALASTTGVLLEPACTLVVDGGVSEVCGLQLASRGSKSSEVPKVHFLNRLVFITSGVVHQNRWKI